MCLVLIFKHGGTDQEFQFFQKQVRGVSSTRTRKTRF